MQWLNRIVERVWLTLEELRANPGNWRVHPKAQQRAVTGLLKEVGIVAPLMAYRSARADGALVLIDGHMRLELGGSWPVDILDVTDTEADTILAFYDVTTGLAEVDVESLEQLLGIIDADDEALRELAGNVAADTGIGGDDDDEEEDKPVDKAEEKQDAAQGELCADCGRRIVVQEPERSEA
jgi:hypothetical protein